MVIHRSITVLQRAAAHGRTGITIKLSRTCFAASLAASCAVFCAGAGAQSLTLSLKLDPVPAPVAQKVAPIIDRCSGRTWAGSIAGVCGADALAASAQPARLAEAAPAGELPATPAETAERTPEESSVASGQTFSGLSLPAIGSLSATSSLLRSAAREVPVQAGKALDLLIRIAPKYRLLNTEDGWDVTKFKDVTSENRTQASGVKAVGVELLFPFQ
jgi:hypothetical protein